MTAAVTGQLAGTRDEASRDAAIRERVGQLEQLLEDVENLPTAPARSRALETVSALMELYGEGLARMMAAAQESSDPGVVAAFVDDPLVAHLLLVHDLHPVDVEGRVAMALEAAGPHLGGAGIHLLGVEGGIARIQLHDGAGGCGGAEEARQLVEDAVYELAPELDGVVVEQAPAGQSVTLGPTRHRPPAPGAL